METYRVRITKQAQEHLAIIRDEIAIENDAPMAAKRLMKRFRENIQSLNRMPDRFKTIDEEPWGSLGYRKLIISSYYVYYLILEDRKQVQIIGVIYSAMNQKKQIKKLKIEDYD